MKHVSLTPFGRQPVSAAHMKACSLAEAPAPVRSVDKWKLIRDLTAARTSFCLSDRDIAVLSALVSFHPETDLIDGNDLIVYPSNAKLSERAHGMAESTLRRHLAALVKSGVIARRDSPNGKRYTAYGPGGRTAFGFDLRPLLVQSTRIAHLAEEARAEAHNIRRLREIVVISLRDSAKLMGWINIEQDGDLIDIPERLEHLKRQLRRKMSRRDLECLASAAGNLRDEIKALICVENTEDLDGNARQNERHYQDSNTNDLESEDAEKASKDPGDASAPLPLEIALKAAPDIADYAPHGVRTWRDLMAVAHVLHPMMDISSDAWREACRTMGTASASLTLACMLQRSRHIHRPGGYLRRLSAKAAEGRFSPLPMVQALLRAEAIS